MGSKTGLVLTAALLVAAFALAAQVSFDPHGDPATGVLRVAENPSTRGQCQQCHPAHGDPDTPGPYLLLLFTENTNQLAFWDEGDGPCHRDRPQNYPLTEGDRLPETEADAGYFEANLGGVRRAGVEYRGRWPGESIFSTPVVTADGHFLSPHAQDPDMPRRDGRGEGLCYNCHDPHPTENPRDLLVAQYGGLGGAGTGGAPAEYALCFSCHGAEGAVSMEPENRRIEDFYNRGLNGTTAGHQIRRNPRSALSWPSYAQVGDMLPCYDCHNPHGSEGYNRVDPNAFLVSDERPEWSGIVDPRGDAAQARSFCLGCHIPADGIPGSKTVEGIVMNAISLRDEHLSASSIGCYDCHGLDYSSSTSNNVHNPAP